MPEIIQASYLELNITIISSKVIAKQIYISLVTYKSPNANSVIGWNGLLLVDTSATARSGPTHSFSYLNTCKCHFFRIAIKARKKIVMTPNCSQCAISRLKM